MQKNSKRLLYMSVIVLILLISIGISYAYFYALVSGSESSKTLGTSAANLELTYADGQEVISGTDLLPGWSASKTFTVTNTGEAATYYALKIVNINNPLIAGSISYEVTSTDGGKNISKTVLPTSDGVVTSGIAIAKGAVHTYTLTTYFNNLAVDQVGDMGKTFSYTMTIVGAKEPPKLLMNEILAQGYDNLDASSYTVPGQEVATTDEGLRTTQDDYGISYYYRGATEDNYVEFANKCWRIVRVTGNGAIKLVLYNDNPNIVDDPCEEEGGSLAFARYNGVSYIRAFNSSYNNNAYVGLMYGNINGTTYDAVHANNTDSRILTSLKAWYDLSFTASQKEMLADTIWCNDKSITSGDGIGTTNTYYGARARLYPVSTASPSLICPNTGSDGKFSKFTASDTTYGNGKLRGVNGVGTNEYKVGLLTADEVAYAGGKHNEANSSYYLNKNASSTNWWIMSPYSMNGSDAYVWIVYSSGYLKDRSVDNSFGARGAVSLKSNTAISGGTGTYDDPFVVNG